MRGISIPFAALLVLLFLAIAPPIQAQEDPLLADILTDLANIDSKIKEWERKADILLALVVAVGMMGLVITAIQWFNKPWAKTVSFFVGLLVSALTFLHQQIFPADRGTYQAVVIDARGLAREVRDNLRLLRLDQSIANDLTKKLDFVRVNITPKLSSTYDLEKRLLMKGSVTHAADQPGSQATGIGECNTSWQAQQNAQVAAVEKLVRLLQGSRPGPWLPSEVEVLRRYVTSYANTTGRRPTFDETSRMFRYIAEMRLHAVFAKDQMVLDYLRQQPPPNQAPKQAAPSLPTGFRVQGALKLPAGFSGGPQVVPVEAGKPDDGQFRFRFNVARPSPQLAQVSLDGIEILQDGSGLSTRWAFQVLVDGKLAFDLPMQRWDDSQKPTRCRFDPQSGFSASVPATGKDLELKVVGYKPKDQ